MAVLIDADVLIEAERGRFDLAAWLASQAEEDFCLAAITVAELWHGVERAGGSHRVRRERFVEALCSQFVVIPYEEQAAREHAQLSATLEAAGRTAGAHDMILAATALQNGDAVATFNSRHFAGIPGLRVVEPPVG